MSLRTTAVDDVRMITELASCECGDAVSNGISVNAEKFPLQSIRATHSRQRGTSRKPGPPVHDDLVGCDFTAGQPDTKWLTDITKHPTDEGTLYLCAVKDCWNSRIVGYAIRSRMTAKLATAALRNAITRRSPAGTIVHSDRGSQDDREPS